MGDLKKALPIVARALQNGGVQGCDEFEAGGLVLAAARRLLEAEEGPRVWWCEEHANPSGRSSERCHALYSPSGCRMVPAKLLIDPQEGESE